jgi:hypothetical protein
MQLQINMAGTCKKYVYQFPSCTSRHVCCVPAEFTIIVFNCNFIQIPPNQHDRNMLEMCLSVSNANVHPNVIGRYHSGTGTADTYNHKSATHAIPNLPNLSVVLTTLLKSLSELSHCSWSAFQLT